MYNAIETNSNAIRYAYVKDPSIIQFSRNSGSLEECLEMEIKCLKLVDKSFKLYKIIDENNTMVGYFGKESFPMDCLTTFFIIPKYRNKKTDIWNFIVSQMPKEFYSALFTVNIRAIKFFEKNGGIFMGNVMAENKPGVVYKFSGVV